MTQQTGRLLKWQNHQKRCQITASHIRTLEDVKVLVAIARSDFPELKDHQIEVKVYLGSMGHANSLGIEFETQERHADYHQGNHLPRGL